MADITLRVLIWKIYFDFVNEQTELLFAAQCAMAADQQG